MKIESNRNRPRQLDRAALRRKLSTFMDLMSEQGAVEPVALELGDNDFTDAIIIAGGTSRRHCRGLADGIARLCHGNGLEFNGMEGYDTAEWILLDCNDLVINIFLGDTRQLYKLEELWGKNLI